MARVVSRHRPRPEGSTSIKFTELMVIGMVIAVIGFGVRYYINYRHSPSFALQEYFGAVKGGDIKKQYEMLDDEDKKYMPTPKDYAQAFKQAHGYTERVVNVTIEPDNAPPDATEHTLTATVDILASGEGKELYQSGSSKGFTDKYVMHKNKDGEWKLVLSKSGDKHNGELNLRNAEPTPDSQF